MLERGLNAFEIKKRPFISRGQRQCLDFSSNDYLGLRFNDELKQAYKDGIEHGGVGSGGSPLVCGYDEVKSQFENSFSEFVGFEQSLFIGSGYCANLSVFSVLFAKDDTAFFIDKSCHASIYDAITLRAKDNFKLYRYPHQDLNALERLLLKSTATKKVIVSEGIFSMTGSQTDIAGLIDLKNKYSAFLVIDDAHSIGVKGANGQGSASFVNSGNIDILICPLGKAFAMQGAVIASSKKIIQNFIQNSRPYIYSTAPCSAQVSALLCALDLIKQADSQRLKLEKNIAQFCLLKKNIKFQFVDSGTAIQFLKCSDLELCQHLFYYLESRNIYCYPIREPTVAKQNAGFRIVISASHTYEHIEKLFKVLGEFNNEFKFNG